MIDRSQRKPQKITHAETTLISGHDEPPFSSSLCIRCTSAGETDTTLRLLPRPTPVDVVGATTPGHQPGHVVQGRYRLLRVLGRGGMGEVWSAHHLGLHTEVAVKFLSPDQRERRIETDALARFQREAHLTAMLGKRTKHVVAVHDAGLGYDGPYLVMELVHGRTLRERLRDDGPLSVDTVAELLEQVGEAIGICHDAGIVHRDIKPANLLLSEDVEGALFVKVADFGIARDLDPSHPSSARATRPGQVVGSPSYMSPEQLAGLSVGPAADLWALGVVAFEALTGVLPGAVAARVCEPPPRDHGSVLDSPAALRPELPRALDAFFERALSIEPERRFGSAAEMVAAFRAAIDPRRQRRTPAFARATFAVAAALVLSILLRPNPSVATGVEAGAAREASALREVSPAGEAAHTRLAPPPEPR